MLLLNWQKNMKKSKNRSLKQKRKQKDWNQSVRILKFTKMHSSHQLRPSIEFLKWNKSFKQLKNCMSLKKISTKKTWFQKLNSCFMIQVFQVKMFFQNKNFMKTLFHYRLLSLNLNATLAKRTFMSFHLIS